MRHHEGDFEAVSPHLLARGDARYAKTVRVLDALMAAAQRHRTSVVYPRLQPVVKWEQLHEDLITAAVASYSRRTYTTVGVNLLAPQDRFRMQLNWIDRSEHPASRKGELVAQFQALF